MDEPPNVMGFAELFCDELYRRRCPPMTQTDLQSFYISLKSDFRNSSWPTFDNLIDAVECSGPEVSWGGGVARRDHYLCAVCCHVFYTFNSFIGHLSSTEHVAQAQTMSSSSTPQSTTNQYSAASFKCILKGCAKRFGTEDELREHIRDWPHWLFFVDQTRGSISYACIHCAALFSNKRGLLAHMTSCQLGDGDQEQERELELSCVGDVTGISETSSGFEVVHKKSAGEVNLTCAVRNAISEDVLINSIELSSTVPLPVLVLDRRSSTPDDAIVLRPGQEWKIELSANDRPRYNYGVYNGTLHVIITKQASGETCVLDWCITLLIISEYHEDLMPTAPYTKVAAKPWKKVSGIVEGAPPFSNISNRLQQKVPLKNYNVPDDLRYQPQHSRSVALSQPLAISTYEAKMHDLLHLEELAIEKSLQTYTLEDATVIEKEDCFILEVPGLAEQRPKLILGAKVKLISESGSSENLPLAHVGYVYGIEGTSVQLRFGGRFRQNFVSRMSFVAEFPLHRQNIQLFHRAVETVASRATLMTMTVFPELGRRSQLSSMDSSATILERLRIRNRLVDENPQQLAAIKAILVGSSYPNPYIIFGPPGTGKTTTIVESIKQVFFCKGDSRILVCTPQNNAADLVAERLLEHIPAEALIRLNAIHRKKSDVLFQSVVKASNYDVGGTVFFPSTIELASKRIVVCTLTTSGRLVSADVGDGFFTHIFVDESGQAIEPEALIPIAGLLRPDSCGEQGGQLILAGDPKQLGPVLHSEAAKLNGLGLSFLERLMTTCTTYATQESLGGRLDERFVTKLLQNFRSHPAILEIPNRLFYDLELKACADVDSRERLCAWSQLPKRGFPIIMHDVRGRDSRESTNPSYFNVSEIETVLEYVDMLLSLRSPKVRPEDIGIITPYKQQVRKITQLLVKKYKSNNTPMNIEKIKVGSVEEFQGQERMAIIVSTVRAERNIGFVGDVKRFNVAITRAKALLVIVGNLNLLSTCSSWNSLIEYCRQHGGIRSHGN